MASSGGHDNTIPSVIVWQVINLVILFFIIFKFAKQPVIDFFSTRQKDYLNQAEKYKALFKAAEGQYADIKARLETLEQTRNESIERAMREAKEMQNQMIKEANEVALRVKEEAAQTAKLEVQKLFQRLHNQLVTDAVLAAKHVLSTDIGSQDHGKLQTEFNKNIEAVNP